MKKKCKTYIYMSIILCLCICQNSFAKYLEQIPLNTKALSLANSVTAYPPGLMSIHYNPAGLSQMGQGKFMSLSLSTTRIERNDKFSPDPSFYIESDTAKYPLTYDPSSIENIRSIYDSTANAQTTRNDRYFYMPILNKTIHTPFTLSPFPMGISYREPDSDFTYATAIYLPLSWGYKNDADDASRYQTKAMYQQHVVFLSPTVSYQPTNYFSVGLSLALGQSAYGTETELRLPTDEIAYILRKRKSQFWGSYFEWSPSLTAYNSLADLTMDLRDDLGFSYNLGLLWQPTKKVTFGLSYQSRIKRRLKGSYSVNYDPQLLGLMTILKDKTADGVEIFIKNLIVGNSIIPSGEGGDVEINNYDYPQSIRMGFKVQPWEKLRLLVDFNWTNWSMIESQIIQFSSPVRILSLYHAHSFSQNTLNSNRNSNIYLTDKIVIEKKFNDTIDWSLGLEYQQFEHIALRFGYERRHSGADNQYFDLSTWPVSNLIGAGVEIKFKKRTTVELGCGYLFSDPYHLSVQVYKGSNPLVSDDSFYINRFSGIVSQGESQNLNSNLTGNIFNNPYPGQNYEMKLSTYFISLNVTMPYDELIQSVQNLKRKLYY